MWFRRKSRDLFAVMAMAGVALLCAQSVSASDPAPSAKSVIEDSADEEAMALLSCVIAFSIGDVSVSKQACGKAIALNTKNPTAYRLRGFTYILERHYDRAKVDFSRAIRLDPGDYENHAGYAAALTGMGHFKASLPFFDTAIRLAPEDARLWAARCWSRTATGQGLSRALADCEMALRISPKLAAGWTGRAFVYLRQGKFDLADSDYSTSLSLRPVQASAWFGRGLSRLHRGDRVGSASDIALARSQDFEIDKMYARFRLLPPTCQGRDDERRYCVEPALPPAALPAAPAAGSPLVAVSYLRDTPGRSEAEEETLAIAMGRIGALLEQTELLMDMPPGESEPGMDFNALHQLAERYNRVRSAACEDSVMSYYDACSRPYLPEWAGAPGAKVTPAAVAKIMDHVLPLWRQVCTHKGSKTDSSLCQME